MVQHHFNAIYEKDGDWWVATAVEIPGAFSQGRTIEEARENLMDAVIELLLARRQLLEEEIARKPDVMREELTVTFN
jgi:predicted RNase H-like HicB family nuclease